MMYSKYGKEKKKAFQSGILDLAKVSFTDEREIKTFIDKKKKKKRVSSLLDLLYKKC